MVIGNLTYLEVSIRVSWRARGGGDEWGKGEVVIAIVIVILSIFMRDR
jgi:hypothetical protein